MILDPQLQTQISQQLIELHVPSSNKVSMKAVDLKKIIWCPFDLPFWGYDANFTK